MKIEIRSERGFINRKVARMKREKGVRENAIRSIDLCIKNLLDRAMKMAKRRKHARKQLDKLVANMEGLQGRLDGENKSFAIAKNSLA